MKKIITVAILLIATISFAQIKVVETVPVERLGKVKSSAYIQKVGEEYTLYFKTVPNDDEASVIKKFSFKDLNNDYEGFYKIISDGFSASPIYDIKLELPDSYVWLHYVVGTTVTTVQFMSSGKSVGASTGVSEPLTLDDINKLFQR
jgi:hypothetical protein